MAFFSMTGGDRFPEGTVVSVYANPALPPAGGVPPGTPVATATVTNGVAVFTGLADSTQYLAYAQVGGTDRYKNFQTDPPATGGGGGTTTTGSGYLGNYTSLAPGTAVSTNQLVSYNGSLYARLADGTISGTFNSANWTLIAGGPAPGGGSYVGDFTALTNGSSIVTNQMVTYSGDLYTRRTNGAVALATPPNQDPTNWAKLTTNGLGYAINPTGAISESFPRYSATNPSLLALASGTLQITPLEVQLPANRLVSQITIHSGDRDAVGQTHLVFAIFDASTRSRLATTIDDLTAGWTADTTKTLALSAPWTPTADTSIRVGVVQVATTTSRLVVPGANGIPAGLLAITNLLGQTADSGLTTAAIPSTYTASAFAQPFYAFVS